jgi:hypothetical protein
MGGKPGGKPAHAEQGVSAMSDKSPRQFAGKKPSRSVKEKRVIKKARKAAAENDRMAVFRRGEPSFDGN